MAAKKPPVVTPPVDDFFAMAAGTAVATGTKATKDKRQVVINDPSFTATLKEMAKVGDLADQCEARYKELRNDVLQNYGFDKFLEGPDAESFILADGHGGSMMIAPVDKGTIIKEDSQMEYLNKTYGDGTVCKSFEFSFDPEILAGEHGKAIMQSISAALAAMNIPTEVKTKVFKAKPILKLRKGLPTFIRTLGPKKGFVAISEIGAQFQVKNPKYNGEASPVLADIVK